MASETPETGSPEAGPPESAIPGLRLPRIVRQFLDAEAAGGVVLLVAAVAAVAWANSPWQRSYETLWATAVSVRFGRFHLAGDLREWVDDGLMTLFFFVAGLEIKRELVNGDLRDPRTAAMPTIAAVGGMAVPALLLTAFTLGNPGARGWGIPMATDIAFAVGVVTLLGPRVPGPLRLFLLTLAIVDDIGAIVVIAVFYAGPIQLAWLAAACGILAVMVGLRRAGVVWMVPYVVLGVTAWLATRASGVHATIAGVALALLAPAGALTPGAVARGWVATLADDPTADELDAMTRLAKTAVSPAERLEHLLLPWTTFAIVPVFALANAGVRIRAATFHAPGAARLAAGVATGLVVGKVAGITGAAWLAVRTGAGRLPEGITWPMMAAVATVAGIGFTVSLFITELAFDAGPLQDAAKLGVLGASTVAAALGALALSRTSPAAATFGRTKREREAGP